jgi:hypothetical protein
MLTYLDINLPVNILLTMVKVIKLMIRKSKAGKKYYRITIPIANEIFDKAEFNIKTEFELIARKGFIKIKSKK